MTASAATPFASGSSLQACSPAFRWPLSCRARSYASTAASRQVLAAARPPGIWSRRHSATKNRLTFPFTISVRVALPQPAAPHPPPNGGGRGRSRLGRAVVSVVSIAKSCAHAPLQPVYHSFNASPGPHHVRSDPDINITGWGESDRGVGYTFGPNVVRDFLDREDLAFVCRAHQVGGRPADALVCGPAPTATRFSAHCDALQRPLRRAHRLSPT